MLSLLLAITAIAFVVYFWRQKSYWSSKGIPGPEPSWFFGNFYALHDFNYPGVLALRDWTKKYGKVYGVMEGSRKILVVSDREMLQELFVKKFEYFYGRKTTAIYRDSDAANIHVFEAQGLRWKRLRTICAPSFSTGSLRKVCETVEDSVMELIHHLDAKRGETINIHRIRKDSAHPMKKQIEAAVDERIAQREELKANNIEIPEPSDFIDLFLDAKADTDYVEDGKEFTKEHMQISRTLSREEIVAQCFLFLLAGFDTTANALAYTISLLARNPEKQTKLQQEIDSVLGGSEIISFDTLSKFKYLEMVIKEALRLYPLAAIAPSRCCMKPTTLGKVPIEEGTLVWADSWALHHDPEIWGADVEEFVPERWEKNQPPEMSYIPFGAGPRLCIGKRLAIMEEKLALAHILSRYTVTTKQDSLKLIGSTTVSPKSVDVVLHPRTS